MKRRKFLDLVAKGVAACAGVLAGVSLTNLAIPGTSRNQHLIKIGPHINYPINTYTFLAKRKIFIYRDHEGVKALSAVCTHLGCVVEKSEDGFQCPCHGSRFNETGQVLSGAAPRNLPCLKVSRAPDGQLLVDISKRVPADYMLKVS
jgi:cytochrome b6-f complex iron-sulfur subunit